MKKVANKLKYKPVAIFKTEIYLKTIRKSYIKINCKKKVKTN